MENKTAMSFINIRKRVGPNTFPRGTPFVILTLLNNVLLNKNVSIHPTRFPVKPKAFNLINSLLCETQ